MSWHLFECVGIELEYMIVDRQTLSVRPIADWLLAQVGGGTEVERGPIAWSNELAMHVIELKTNGPVATLDGAAQHFQQGISEISQLLGRQDAVLLGTGMHPWMQPDDEFRIWPHEYNQVYRAFDRIFGCRGHGWSNLQSTHINLPFTGDAELALLHDAIRLVLPILPALAASSPFMEGRHHGYGDQRLEVYRHNARRVPQVTGQVIPPSIDSRQAYQSLILEPIYEALDPLDPEGVLCNEWVNARGCIARFDRMAVEIRVLDIQEHAAADLAIVAAVTGLVRKLCEDGPARLSEDRLAPVFLSCVQDTDQAWIEESSYLKALGLRGRPMRARDVWLELAGTTSPFFSLFAEHGCLSRRILAAAGTDPDADTLRSVYRQLGDCLVEGAPFEA